MGAPVNFCCSLRSNAQSAACGATEFKTMANQDLFRKRAIERVASPDNLEQLMPAAVAKDWLMIAVLTALLGLAIAWSIVGRVPTIAAGRGVILRPRQVVEAQSGTAGRIVALRVRSGDRLKVGDLIATVDEGDVRKKIEEDRKALALLEEEDRHQSTAGADHLNLQSQQDRMERVGLEAQRENLRKSLASALEMRPMLATHLDANHKLISAGLIAIGGREILDAEAGLRDNEAKIDDYNSRLSQIDGQVKQIDTRGAALSRQVMDDGAVRRNQIDQLRRTIAIDEFQLWRNGNIYSQYSGRVAEVLAAPGEVLPAGGRLLTLEAEQGDNGLISISYFPVRDGKKIQAGMPIQVTPDTVERERFGGMLGTVVSVSPIPVTKDGAKSVLGNPELVTSLMPEGAYIEVRARLETDADTISGYRWSSSQGPPIQITSGLTHSTRVTIEGRAPLTYLLPILREGTGLY